MRNWLVHALVTMLLWGVWGAFAGLPGEHGLPETLNYVRLGAHDDPARGHRDDA